MWYKLSTCEQPKVRKYMFRRGYNTSQQLKKYSVWDDCIEPLIIRQFGIIFTGGHAFIYGMTLDNDDQDGIHKDLNYLKDDIEREIRYDYNKNELMDIKNSKKSEDIEESVEIKEIKE
jgi:hypothetical protein